MLRQMLWPVQEATYGKAKIHVCKSPRQRCERNKPSSKAAASPRYKDR